MTWFHSRKGATSVSGPLDLHGDGALSSITDAAVGAAAPSVPTGPEPSRVYGYVAFVDPATGAEYFPTPADDPSLNGPMLPGPIWMQFVSPSGGTLDLSVGMVYRAVQRNPDGSILLQPIASAGIALYYDIEMRSGGGTADPRVETSTGLATDPHTTAVVTYNPGIWRFGSIRVDPFGAYAPSAESLGRLELVTFPMTRRAVPFADLPDMP